ncbi:MAG TPA: FtsX-like permease family protein [Syntrophorhabdaceae bacterium]|jgi:ABC-type lipoprotein release transport system permease subunit
MAWIEKERNIIDFALSSLLRKRGKNLALFLIYTIIVFILSSIFFFTASIKKEASRVLALSPEVTVQRIVAGRHDLMPANYIPVISGIPGVREVRGRLWGYYFEPSTGANYTVIAREHGMGPREGAMNVGWGVARTLNVGKGDVAPLKASDGSYMSFEVNRVFSSESEIVSSDLIEINQEDFRGLFSMNNGYWTDITLVVRNKNETVTVANKIKRLLPDTRPILRDEILRTYDAIFDWRGGLLIFILGGAVLAFAILAWDKATSLSFEERREIGILKAVGWETSEVIVMKSWEGIAVSLTSFLVGVIAGYCHVFFASYIFFEPVLKGWSVLYPHFRLVPSIDAYQIAALFFLTVVPYTTATIIPSWKAAIIDPDEVMRL